MNPNSLKKIILTGGGTAGHVTPNLALIPLLQSEGWCIAYIGSEHGVERTLIGALSIPYHPIPTGKLRRYWSWQNLADLWRVMRGVVQSYRLIRKIKPQLIFSKGGFVALPVVIGGWLNRIPIVAHESDFSMGLANRLSWPFVDKLCVSFAGHPLKKHPKLVVTGTPIRAALWLGDRRRGLHLCGFQPDKLCILVMGGGQGSGVINQCIRQSLDALTERAQVIHLCGQGKLDQSLLNRQDYYQLEYADAELPDLLAASDMVVSRAGANTLYELLALVKPHILIPLSRRVSRGDQIQNAQYFQGLGISHVIQEEQLTPACLLAAIDAVHARRDDIVHNIAALNMPSGSQCIIDLLDKMVSSS